MKKENKESENTKIIKIHNLQNMANGICINNKNKKLRFSNIFNKSNIPNNLWHCRSISYNKLLF